MKRKKIVAMGFMAQMPVAGVIWQHIHYLVALQRLGHDVYYIEDSLNPYYDPVQFTWTAGPDYAGPFMERLAAQYGFEGKWCLCARSTPGPVTAGLSKARMLELYREADAILNICGAQEPNDDLLTSDRLIYLESDPGLDQIRVDQGNAVRTEFFRRQHALFTFGENIGAPDFPVPLHGFSWQPTRQPVVTDFWKAPVPAKGAVFTSIANWSTAGQKDIEWNGETYLWSKSLEFLKFVEAPARAGETFELSSRINDAATRELFLKNGWRLNSPDELSLDCDLYRRYVQESKGEFTAAKDQYIRLNTGWFSDRSACYLAAGRPVITQETGFSKYYGGQRGLFSFRTLEEIPEAVREINADYALHSRAAFEIAAEYFEATKVVGSILDRAGV